ncbi:MAG: hypothetical protein IPO91_19330 [Chloroflexi bacterium]|nr:hypothetical protein [Chloroflexota bacterium]
MPSRTQTTDAPIVVNASGSPLDRTGQPFVVFRDETGRHSGGNRHAWATFQRLTDFGSWGAFYFSMVSLFHGGVDAHRNASADRG